MYAREKEWDEAGAKAKREPAARAKLRQAHFARGLFWLDERVLRLRERVRPKSGLGQATGYLLGQWEALRAHLSHGQTRLDTKVVENHIRPTALGKKNWLFIPLRSPSYGGRGRSPRGGTTHRDPLLDHHLVSPPRARPGGVYPGSAHASAHDE
jgi:hypothetical protein